MSPFRTLKTDLLIRNVVWGASSTRYIGYRYANLYFVSKRSSRLTQEESQHPALGRGSYSKVRAKAELPGVEGEDEEEEEDGGEDGVEGEDVDEGHRVDLVVAEPVRRPATRLTLLAPPRDTPDEGPHGERLLWL